MRPLALLFLATLPAGAADFLWLSDIHFDPLADHALVDKLAAAEPPQWAAILATGSTKFPTYGQDTNWPLFSSILQASAKTAPNSGFTIVTGDMLVHHFREHFDAAATVHDDAAFRSFVRKSVEFVALQLKQRSPGKPVFMTIGNNDDECADYAIQPDGPYLQDTAQTVSNTESYKHLGSYSVANPSAKHQRIIVLNTVFFSYRYVNRCGQGGDDPGDQLLSWLSTELESAKTHHEKVWLVYHIPPGVDAYGTLHAKVPGSVISLWKDAYLSKFTSLLDQYSAVVNANFAGHVHVDDFRILGKNVVLIAPAVSPITGQNPTFRTVKFDSHGTLKDQSTYYLKSFTDWELEYTFSKEWHLKGLNAKTYSTLFSRIQTSQEVAARWMTLYSASHNSVAPNLFPGYFCSAGNISAKSYEDCNHAKTTN